MRKQPQTPKNLAFRNEAAQRLREAREKAGLTQADLARDTKVSQSSIADYERGRSIPGYASLSRIAKRLQTTPDWLYTGVKPGDTQAKVEVSGTFEEVLAWANAQVIWTDTMANNDEYEYFINKLANLTLAAVGSTTMAGFGLLARSVWTNIMMLDAKLPLRQRIDLVLENVIRSQKTNLAQT